MLVVADGYKKARPSHCTILAVDNAGLKNLFKIVIDCTYGNILPCTACSPFDLRNLRQGLIVGSGCSNGELFETMMNKTPEEAERMAKFYDYLEVMPKPVYSPLVERGTVHDEWAMEDIIRRIVKLGKKLNITGCRNWKCPLLR